MYSNDTNQFAGIDLSSLPPPEVIETPDFEDIYNKIIDQINGYIPLTFDNDRKPLLKDAEIVTDPNGEKYFKIPVDEKSGLLYLCRESDPLTRLAEVTAYREMWGIMRANMRSYAVMVAYAIGSDLDQLGTLFGVYRLVIENGDPDSVPPVDPVYESDEDYRRRIILAPDSYSVAGPTGAYVYHALSADPEVLDAYAEGTTFNINDNGDVEVVDDAGLEDPQPGNVAITVLSRNGNGNADRELLKTVSDALNDNNIRPVNDRPVTRSADIIEYAVTATIYTYQGPDPSVVIDTAKENIKKYVNDMHRIGLDVAMSGIYQALHVDGVQRVEITSPTNDLKITERQASYCSEDSINITHGGTDA